MTDLLIERRSCWPAFERLIVESRGRRLRTIRQFAEDEIIIPSGDYRGERFRCDTQPYSRLIFDAIDSRQWNHHVILGCVQSGKTLCGFAIPVMWETFEHGNSGAIGIPDLDMVGDKWRVDLRPVIEASAYRELLPFKGAASREGGTPILIQFRNGASIRFMTGGASDQGRAGFSADFAAITETDKFHRAETSKEGHPIKQILDRTKARGERARTYRECTVTIKQGHIWRSYESSTLSRIACPCPHCEAWVTPEREHLLGWQDAEDILAAKAGAFWSCPECGARLTEPERAAMNRGARLIHQSKGLDGNLVECAAPRMDTAGIRWSAFNNLFWPAATPAADEWTQVHSFLASDDGEIDLCQHIHAIPYVSPEMDTSPLDPHVLETRVTSYSQGIFPPDTEHGAMGIDIGKWQCHWAMVSMLPGPVFPLVDYGSINVPSNFMDEDLAIETALRQWWEQIQKGWEWHGQTARRMPEQIWIDSGYRPHVIYKLALEWGARVKAVKGYGSTQREGRERNYHKPKKLGNEIQFIGDGYHFTYQAEQGIHLGHVDADAWKSWLHRRLRTPSGEPNSFTLFDTKQIAYGKHFHMDYVKSLTAERPVKRILEGRGEVLQWEVVHKNKSHWLDATYLACAALDFCARNERPAPSGKRDSNKQAGLTTPDGRPYCITDRN